MSSLYNLCVYMCVFNYNVQRYKKQLVTALNNKTISLGVFERPLSGDLQEILKIFMELDKCFWPHFLFTINFSLPRIGIRYQIAYLKVNICFLESEFLQQLYLVLWLLREKYTLNFLQVTEGRRNVLLSIKEKSSLLESFQWPCVHAHTSHTSRFSKSVLSDSI